MWWHLSQNQGDGKIPSRQTAGLRISCAEGTAFAEALSKNREEAHPLCVALGPRQGGWAQNDGGEEGRGQVVQGAPSLGWLLSCALDPALLGRVQGCALLLALCSETFEVQNILVGGG